MSWNNCKKCVLSPRTNFSSALLKVLLTIKMLHGSRTGFKGSTLEDIAMQMIKHFNLDGDIKSQVLATLKFGVKMHYIQKRKDKFSVIAPTSSVQLAPCKYKKKEIERIHCLYPPAWYDNACSENSCGTNGDEPCCGKRKRRKSVPGMCQEEDNSNSVCDPCHLRAKQSRSTCGSPNCSQNSFHNPPRRQDSCDRCFPPFKRRKRSASRSFTNQCQRQKPSGKSVYDNYCVLCGRDDDEESDRPEAYVNCSCCQLK